MSKVQYLIEAEVRTPDGMRWTRFPEALPTLGMAKRLIEKNVPVLEAAVVASGKAYRRLTGHYRIIETLTFSVIYEKEFPQ